MSGPKVLHVVTREEVEAICRRWLLLVGEAAADLGRVATRLGLMDAALQSRIDARRAALESLMESERWLDLQKKAPAAIEHFRAEAGRLRDDAVAQAALARSKRRRLVDAARSVSASLAASGKVVPAALDEVVARAMNAPDSALDAMRSAVEAAIGSIVSAVNSAATAEQSGLAAKLGANGAGPVSIAAWSSANVKPDPRAERLDGLLAELATRFPSALDAGALAGRAASIGAEPSQNRRSLLTDSLILEVGRRVREEGAAEAAVNDAAATRAELAVATGDEAKRHLSELEAAIAMRHTAGIAAAAAAGDALLEAARRRGAAAARRRAVLGGLAALGYEVREGMEAAWAQDGRIVVQRSGAEDYGVELAAPPDASRLQARLVGSDRPRTARDAGRDKDQETIWCGQFDQLRAIVGKGGGHIEIERALSPGEQAVKTVSLPSQPGYVVEVEGRSLSKPQAR